MPSNSELGSKNYENSPEAVLLGAGYSEQDIEGMREASKDFKRVPWLRPDTTKAAPPLGPEYGQALVARIKETIKELSKKGKLAEDTIIWY